MTRSLCLERAIAFAFVLAAGSHLRPVSAAETKVHSTIPLGIDNPEKTTALASGTHHGPYPPDVVRIVIGLSGKAGKKVVAPISAAYVTGEDLPKLPAGFPRTRAFVNLTRASDNPADPGYSRYFSPQIILIADPRAQKSYTRSAEESSLTNPYACQNCQTAPDYQPELSTLAPDGAGETRSNPIDAPFEMWAGEKIVLRFAENAAAESALKSALGYLQNVPLQQVAGGVATTRGDLTPALKQLPAQNPSLLPTEAGVALSTHSGGTRWSQTDLSIRGRGIDFVLGRNYVSDILYFGPFGRNMESPLFARLRPLPSGDVDFYPGDGTRQTFVFHEDEKAFEAPSGVFLDLYRPSADQFILISPDHTLMFFDGQGKLTKISDRNTTKEDGSDGNSMRFLYDGAGHLVQILDPVNRPVNFSYYSPDIPPGAGGGYPGLIRQVTDYDNRTVSYTYTSDGQLREIIGPDPESAGSAAPHRTLAWSAPSGDTKSKLYRGGELLTASDNVAGHAPLFTLAYPSAPALAGSIDVGGGSWDISPGTGGETTVTDPRGNATVYAHDDAGHPIQIRQPGGANGTTALTYDGEGRLEGVVRPLGDGVQYAYQAASDPHSKRNMGNVVTVTETPRAGSSDAPRITSIGYEARSNQVVSYSGPEGSNTITRDQRGNPTSITDNLGVTATTSYDERGLLQTVDDPRSGHKQYTYETTDPLKMGYLTDVTVRASVSGGGTTHYENDNRGNVTGMAAPNRTPVSFSVNALNFVTGEQSTTGQKTYNYDAAGNMTDIFAQASSGSDGQPIFVETHYDYDELHSIRRASAPEGTTQYGFDSAHNLETIAKPDGKTVIYGLDQRNRIASKTLGGATENYVYDDDDNRISVTSPRGKVTGYLLDGFGRLTGSRDPSGLTTVSALDSAGHPSETRVISADNHLYRWTQSSYDPVARVQTEIRKVFATPIALNPDGSVPDGTSVQDAVTKWTLDGAGNVIAREDPLHRVARTEFDSLGRQIKATDPAGNTIEYGYDAAGNRSTVTETDVRSDDGTKTTIVTAYEFDDANRVTKETDNLGHFRTFSYDSRGYLVSEKDALGEETTYKYDDSGRRTEIDRPEGIVTRFQYDGNNNLTSVVGEPGDRTTQYSYDGQNRLVTITYPDSRTLTYGYDDDGNVVSETESPGSIVTILPDDNGRPLQRSFGKGAGVEGPDQESFTYDALGRLISADNGEARVDLSYDSLDQMTSDQLTLPTGIYPSGKSYDLAGNPISIAYPSGRAITLEPDTLDRIAAIREGGIPIGGFVFQGPSLTSRKLLGNNLSMTTSFDAVRHPTDLLAADGAGNPALHHQYGWTSTDRKSFVTLTTGKSDLYTYDSALRLSGEILGQPGDPTNPSGTPDATKSFTYDTANALLGINDSRAGNQAATNDAVNRLLTLGALSATWDTQGNLAGKSSGDQIVYDAAHRPLRIQHSDGSKDEYRYDALGRRYEHDVTADGTTKSTLEVSCGEHVIAEYVNGRLDREYVWGNDPDELVQIKRDSDGNGTLDQTLYPLTDELNTVYALTDQNGQVVERYRYESGGKAEVEAPDFTPESGSLFGNTITWQGRPWTGNYGYFRNRWLDTDTHSWLTPDPAHYPDNVANAYAPFGRDGGINTEDPWGLYYVVSARKAPSIPLAWLKAVDEDGRVLGSLTKRHNVTIFIHGYNVDEAKAEYETKHIEGALRKWGYDGNVIGFGWHGDEGFGGSLDNPLFIDHGSTLENSANFGGNVLNARSAAASLARLVNTIRGHVSGIKINLLSHSLGAEVLLGGLQILSEWRTPVVDTAIMMEAAVPAAYLLPSVPGAAYIRDSSSWSGYRAAYGASPKNQDADVGRYQDAPSAVVANQFFNFYSTSDGVLSWAYQNVYNSAGAIGGKRLDPLELLDIRNVNTSPGALKSPFCEDCGVASHGAFAESARYWETIPVYQELVKRLNRTP